jgi:short-subunit dehydrogenase
MTADAGWVLVLGATSPLAQGAIRELAGRGHDVVLAGRDVDELDRHASDLRIRSGCATAVLRFDAECPEGHPAFVEALLECTDGRLRGVVACIGAMGDPDRVRTDLDAARWITEVNFTAQVSVLTPIAEWMANHGGGFVIGVGSVAGDRGRQSNYPYGAAKGAFALWLQGLRNRMHGRGVRVLTVKPGFLDTRMTFGFQGGPLVADPFEAGRTMVRRLDRSRDVVYLPWFWRWIMLVIRAIPEPLFKRLSL